MYSRPNANCRAADWPAITGGQTISGIIEYHRKEISMTSKIYAVPAISCGHCVATIERELKDVTGVKAVKADLNKTVVVEVDDPSRWTVVEATLEEIGYPAALN
jgi:copper chaperone CopZ